MIASILGSGILYWTLLVVYVVCCGILITVVLLQKGKGSGFAGAFGVGGGSDAVFGPRASKSLPARLTTIMASIFLFLAFALSLIEGRQSKGVAPEKENITAAKEKAALSGLDSAGIGKGAEAIDTSATSDSGTGGAATTTQNAAEATEATGQGTAATSETTTPETPADSSTAAPPGSTSTTPAPAPTDKGQSSVPSAN